MLCKLVLLTILLHVALSFVVSDDENDQVHKQIPIPRTDGPRLWTLVEEPTQPGGVLSYSRLGRKLFKLPQTIIPYPRTGRMLDPDVYDYDLPLVPDYPWRTIECPCLDTLAVNKNKKASVIVRKKRSISDDDSEQDDDDAKRQGSMSRFSGPDWSSFEEELTPDFFYRMDRQSAGRSRNAFVPRVGKKRSEDVLEDKRAMAFQPRIGRASLIPRIGRNDPRFKVESRGAFIPRIGKRLTFAPRIGRSDGRSDGED